MADGPFTSDTHQRCNGPVNYAYIGHNATRLDRPLRQPIDDSKVATTGLGPLSNDD